MSLAVPVFLTVAELALVVGVEEEGFWI